MKKKIFAALAASVMLCGVLTAPASAEAKYKKGDVNMDGEIDSADAMLALMEYCNYVVALNDHILSAEQIELANVTDLSTDNRFSPNRSSDVVVDDAQAIIIYYTECLANSALKETDITVWCKEKYPHLYAK